MSEDRGSGDLLAAATKMAKAARSWHDYHHGSDIVACDEICDALLELETAVRAEIAAAKPAFPSKSVEKRVKAQQGKE